MKRISQKLKLTPQKNSRERKEDSSIENTKANYSFNDKEDSKKKLKKNKSRNNSFKTVIKKPKRKQLSNTYNSDSDSACTKKRFCDRNQAVYEEDVDGNDYTTNDAHHHQHHYANNHHHHQQQNHRDAKTPSSSSGRTQMCITDLPPVGPSRRKSTNMTSKVYKNILDCKDSQVLMKPTLTSATEVIEDSIGEGHRLFSEIISPISSKTFFEQFWEKKPILVKRHSPNHNDPWFSLKEMKRIICEERLYYGENIDVVTFTNGIRETHNPAGRVHSSILWDYYRNGCSVRLLNPQTYCHQTWRRLSLLQEYFGSMAGANVYLTPPNTQGFAPHWDDIEAFILQIEGKKHWRVYPNRSESEKLPRFSSDNLKEDDVGEPAIDVILEPGDLLYFPRGYIHQGKTLKNEHSLHITFSCAQKHSWGDLMEKVLPNALQTAFAEDVELRKSLPIDYLNYMGVVYSEENLVKRDNFIKHVHLLASRIIGHISLDSVCDQHSKNFIHDSLPPFLTQREVQRTVNNSSKSVENEYNKLDIDTKVKLLRRNMIRLVMEKDSVFIFHSTENGRLYHKRPLQSIEIDDDLAPAVEYLVQSYPKYVSVDSLPCDSDTKKIVIADLLYENGILMTSSSLGFTDSNFDHSQLSISSNSTKSEKKKNKKTPLRIEKATSF